MSDDGHGPNEKGQRVLVTIHLPIDAGVVARIGQAVANRYPDAAIGSEQQGRLMVIYDRRPNTPELPDAPRVEPPSVESET